MSESRPGIVTDIEDEPHIEGRRLTVRRIGALAEKRGLNPETIAERFDLDLEAVHAALAYYYDHPDQMAALESERRARTEASRDESIDPADVFDDPSSSA